MSHLTRTSAQLPPKLYKKSVPCVCECVNVCVSVCECVCVCVCACSCVCGCACRLITCLTAHPVVYAIYLSTHFSYVSLYFETSYLCQPVCLHSIFPYILVGHIDFSTPTSWIILFFDPLNEAIYFANPYSDICVF